MAEFNRLLALGLSVVERNVENSLPDPHESALIGSHPEGDGTEPGFAGRRPLQDEPLQTEDLRTSTNSGTLRKSLVEETGEKARQQALREFARRLSHVVDIHFVIVFLFGFLLWFPF